MKKSVLALTASLLLLIPSDALAKGGKSFSGGSGFKSSFKSSPSIKPSFKPSVSPSIKPSGGKSFSGGSSSSSSSNIVSPSVKPKVVSIDLKAVRDHGTVASRTAYKAELKKSEAPKPSYTNKSGKTVQINPKDKKVEEIRKDTTNWVNRESRSNVTYNHYHNKPPIFAPTSSFNDHFNPWFFMWLMEKSSDDRARWVYHHKEDMDPERYKQLSSKDTQLEARVKQLEKEGVKKDSTYVPKGIDADLQYDDDFVDAVVNPEKEVSDDKSSGASGGWIAFWIVIAVIVGFVLFAVIISEV